MKASLPTKPMYCSREYFKTSREKGFFKGSSLAWICTGLQVSYMGLFVEHFVHLMEYWTYLGSRKGVISVGNCLKSSSHLLLGICAMFMSITS